MHSNVYGAVIMTKSFTECKDIVTKYLNTSNEAKYYFFT